MDSKEKYVEIASGHITNRGNSVKKSLLHNYIDKKEKCNLYAIDRFMDKVDELKNLIYQNIYKPMTTIILDIDKKDLDDNSFLDYVRYFVNSELINELSIEEEHIQIWLLNQKMKKP